MMCNIDDREDDHENQDKAIDQFDSEDDRSYYLNAKNVLTDCNVQTVCVKQDNLKQKVHFPGLDLSELDTGQSAAEYEECPDGSECAD